MRIRGSAASSVLPTPTISVSPSSPSSSSSCFSSSSTISDHSLSSSSNSTSSLFSIPCRRRCQGLDLLVKAVYHVAGSVIGVPYIQKRVIRRRKPAVRFNNLVISPSYKEGVELENNRIRVDMLDWNSEEKKQKKMTKKKKKQRRRRSKASVLRESKPVNRPSKV